MQNYNNEMDLINLHYDNGAAAKEEKIDLIPILYLLPFRNLQQPQQVWTPEICKQSKGRT